MTANDTLYYFHQQPDSVELPVIDITEASLLKESPWSGLSTGTYAPRGIDVAARPYALPEDDGAVAVLLVLFVLGVRLFSRSWRYMSNAVTEFFFSRSNANIYDAGKPDSVLHGGLPLYLFSALAGGLTLYVVQGYVGRSGMMPDVASPLLDELGHGLTLLLCVGAVSLAIAVKVTVLQMVNSTFFSERQRSVWRDGLRLVWLLGGVALWLVIVAAVFFGVAPQSIQMAVLLVIAVAKLLILIKTHSAFFPRANELSRLILYFCTLELAPALLLAAFLMHQ